MLLTFYLKRIKKKKTKRRETDFPIFCLYVDIKLFRFSHPYLRYHHLIQVKVQYTYNMFTHLSPVLISYDWAHTFFSRILFCIHLFCFVLLYIFHPSLAQLFEREKERESKKKLEREKINILIRRRRRKQIYTTTNDENLNNNILYELLCVFTLY